MKILHTADWHIGQFKGPVVDGVNLRLQDTVKCLEYMVEVAQKEKPDIVCISGDIFHQEQIGPVRYSDEMIIATDTITKLADIAKGVIVMRGTPNHDGSGQFRVLDRMFVKTSHVHIITAPTVLHTPYTDIACIPGFDKQEFRAKFPGLSADEENLAWTKYISDMVFALRAECEKTPILMAHYTVPGCNMESGQTSFFTNFEPVIPREALMAARYEAVLLGHIHRPQIIEGFDNVFYSGAINAMNFNDEGQERGFWIHEFNEKGTLVKEHRYTTPYRQFHTITWDPDEVGDYIREGAMYLHRTGISEEVTDKIVRVRYSCTSEQKKALNIPLLQLQQIRSSYSKQISDAENKRDYHQTRLREIKQQEEFMKNSGCPDIENASCRFLAKAVDDVKNLPVERGCLQKFEKEIETLTSEMNKKVAEKQKEIWEIGYNPDQLKLLLIQVNGLAKYERIKKDAEQNKLEIARLEAEKESNDKNIGQCEENLLQVKLKASEITETVNKLSESVGRQEQIKQQMAHLQTYVEQEKELPVYEERKQHVLERIESMEKEMEKLTDRKFILSSQLTGMDTMIEKMKETFSADMVEETDRQIRSNKETLGELQIQKGVLLERLENIDTMRGEISTLNNGIAVAAGRADCYEALKQAFSQDGVPHQIIRNIIPHITDTTNNILGQMTGGTMGVEFVMERTVKGKDGDKATLDVLINEYGKTTLPYASKSGGEKVKASLAVILALSEIKATAAGIQLGMLFIDEPPFLDDEGAQAYVDALETIRDRYSDVKIMAITHDDAMKARIGQAVTVIKTDDGSKVIY